MFPGFGSLEMRVTLTICVLLFSCVILSREVVGYDSAIKMTMRGIGRKLESTSSVHPTILEMLFFNYQKFGVCSTSRSYYIKWQEEHEGDGEYRRATGDISMTNMEKVVVTNDSDMRDTNNQQSITRRTDSSINVETNDDNNNTVTSGMHKL